MKQTTVIRYETSDGRTFGDEIKAGCHEIETFARDLTDAEGKLTALQLMTLMVQHPKAFAEKLKWFEPDEPEAAEPEVKPKAKAKPKPKAKAKA